MPSIDARCSATRWAWRSPASVSVTSVQPCSRPSMLLAVWPWRTRINSVPIVSPLNGSDNGEITALAGDLASCEFAPRPQRTAVASRLACGADSPSMGDHIQMEAIDVLGSQEPFEPVVCLLGSDTRFDQAKAPRNAKDVGIDRERPPIAGEEQD